MSLASDTICPECGSDLRGKPIPGTDSHYRRVIGVEYHGGYDGISEWACPDCGRREGRWTGKVLHGEESEPRYGGER